VDDAGRSGDLPRMPGDAPVTADLPGLPGVPERVGPVPCPLCAKPAATVTHVQLTPGPGGPGDDYRAEVDCAACGYLGAVTDRQNYLLGCAVGVRAERARTSRVYIVVAAGDTAGAINFLASAGLTLLGVFTDPDQAGQVAASRGEIHSAELTRPGGEPR
jgi:hypothetical protein